MGKGKGKALVVTRGVPATGTRLYASRVPWGGPYTWWRDAAGRLRLARTWAEDA